MSGVRCVSVWYKSLTHSLSSSNADVCLWPNPNEHSHCLLIHNNTVWPSHGRARVSAVNPVFYRHSVWLTNFIWSFNGSRVSESNVSTGSIRHIVWTTRAIWDVWATFPNSFIHTALTAFAKRHNLDLHSPCCAL